jgi:pyruvate/2-oxoglutarate/acetoin dehydrogenase E1 component
MVEMQFGDFITCGFNQIVNNLAKTHWRWGGRVPVVIRAPVGGGTGAGPFHSQCVESWFTAVAGIKVVAPATPYDAKGLLLAAFEDGNPVLYLEHKLLYRSARGRVPAGHYSIPLGLARVARDGADATVVTYGVGVGWALEAAAVLAGEGRELEVVDLRSLVPWDVETVVRSVAKTGRCFVLHEAPLTGGFGGEIAATVGREAFEWLDGRSRARRPRRRCREGPRSPVSPKDDCCRRYGPAGLLSLGRKSSRARRRRRRAANRRERGLLRARRGPRASAAGRLTAGGRTPSSRQMESAARA